jgi:hypothetical protein
MNQPMFTSCSSNFHLQSHDAPVRRISFPAENKPDRDAFRSTEINRWIARWENEGGAVAIGRSADHLTS